MDDPSTAGVTEGFGLMFYNARWYDPALGRFAQADSIVPGGVQGLDRYAAMNNNPVRYIDPSGHFSRDEIIDFFGVDNWSQVLVIFDNGRLKDRWGWLIILLKAEIGDKISITMDDMTITGTFDQDVSGNLIVTFEEQNYYIDQEKAALLGDSYELSKEADLSDFFCSPYTCTMEYYNFETDGVIPVPPYMNNPDQNKYLSNPNDKTLWEWFKDQFTEYSPETHDSPSPSSGSGGGGGVLPVDVFLLD
jgi:RHS repeat-associated protein